MNGEISFANFMYLISCVNLVLLCFGTDMVNLQQQGSRNEGPDCEKMQMPTPSTCRMTVSGRCYLPSKRQLSHTKWRKKQTVTIWMLLRIAEVVKNLFHFNIASAFKKGKNSLTKESPSSTSSSNHRIRHLDKEYRKS